MENKVCPSLDAKELHTLLGRTVRDICGLIRENNLTDKVIFCLDGAAGVLGMSNRLMMPKAPVYTNLSDSELPEFLEKIPCELGSKEIITHCGFQCTSPEQTLLDMLEAEDGVGNQDLYEALADYYAVHGDSFQPLESKLNAHQRSMLDMYAKDAIHYYSEE